LDRLILALSEQGSAGAAGAASEAPAAVVVGADPGDTVNRLRIATELRSAGIAARADLARRKLGKQLEAAAREHAHFAVIVGDELAAGEVQLRDLPAGTQKPVAIADLSREIARAHGAHRHGGDG
jgi:histidyl-tRNA synthetase